MNSDSESWKALAATSLGLVPAVMLFAWNSYLVHKRQLAALQAQPTVEIKSESAISSYAWTIGSRKLEAYFDRNLAQVHLIFWVSMIAMCVGFSFILWGLFHSFSNSGSTSGTYASIAAGTVSEFISLTFMLIYRSTLKQASSFILVLERINAVGMAVQILDEIGNEDKTLKNETRAEIVKQLLSTDTNVERASTRRRASHVRSIRSKV